MLGVTLRWLLASPSRTLTHESFLIAFFVRYDNLTITNENGKIFGVICGEQRDNHITVTGYQARITFHSDSRIEKTGFLLFFTTVPHRGEYNHNMMLGTSEVVDGKDRIVLSLSQLHKKDQLRPLKVRKATSRGF